MLKIYNKLFLAGYVYLLAGLLIASVISTQMVANSQPCDCPTKEEVVKYVQGGLTWPGRGSKHAPYNSLALAQADKSWDILIVLPSEFALDGGITMRPGTQLIGAINPVHGPVAADQPTITNSSAALNGGNGVVVQSGNVSIKNIHFKDTWSSGINYDNAKTLKVYNVLISGANQGGVTALLPDPNDPAGTNGSYYVGGIQATATHDGHTFLRNVIVKDNIAGQGVAESIKDGVCREFHANHCEFSGLGQLLPRTTLPRVDGILLMAFGAKTKHKAIIKKCNFHDYNMNTTQARHIGFEARPSGGAVADYEFDRCNVVNLNVDPTINNIRGDAVVVVSVDVNPNLPVSATQWRLKVSRSRFTDVFSNGSVAINLQQKSSVSDVVIIDNTIQDFDNAVASFIGGTGAINHTLIKGNNARAFNTFFQAAAWGGALNAAHQKVTIKNNNVVGGPATGAIAVFADFEPNSNWANLIINAKNNCFTGQAPNSVGLGGYDFGTNGAGNATINAHHNNITGFSTDIFDDKANVNYFAQNNWWGQPSGPDNIVNLGTGVVDVSHPLHAPIKCPKLYC